MASLNPEGVKRSIQKYWVGPFKFRDYLERRIATFFSGGRGRAWADSMKSRRSMSPLI
jgi:hypothetical protein